MKFDTSGIPICGSILNNVSNLVYKSLNGVACYASGPYVYTASIFQDTVFCGPDTLLANGSQDIFVGRWKNCGELDVTPVTSLENNITVYPNPNNGTFTVACHSEGSEESIANIKVYNMLGENVYSQTLRYTQGDNIINLFGQPNGIYLYRVITEDGNLLGEGKVIIAK